MEMDDEKWIVYNNVARNGQGVIRMRRRQPPQGPISMSRKLRSVAGGIAKALSIRSRHRSARQLIRLNALVSWTISSKPLTRRAKNWPNVKGMVIHQDNARRHVSWENGGNCWSLTEMYYFTLHIVPNCHL
ncbi:hypothetical protein AVEN_127445-1 [Araneus ventricosus]|uniref:Uncharacterized protein n=1 Tax=Araneus ventricosus TaxID=182803 RepID=A0A4Y2LGA1_ARAVE|nr:hypothetical protein AVEN_127445-1 [Araneus ventricosus]